MKRLLAFSLLVPIIVIAWSCVDEGPFEDYTDKGKEIRIHFNLDIPPTARLYSLSVDDQDEDVRIDAVDILAFEKWGNDHKFHYAYSASNIRITGATEMEISASVKQYPGEQLFLILCNATDEIAAADIRPNEVLDDVLVRIKCGGETMGEWPTKIKRPEVFKPFPMYAKTTPQVISDMNNDLGRFSLVRMVARADITMNDGIDNFILVNARVFNRTVYGYVAYDYSAWNDGTKSVTSAGVPPENDFENRPDILFPSVIYDANNVDDPRGKIVKSIYLFESEGVTETDRLKGTAIIVGGKYNGSGTVTYYRIDIKTVDTPSGYISQDILRNHWYQIEIQGVSGTGYETPYEAYWGGNVLSAKITPWNLASQQVVATSQYRLKVSKDQLIFPEAGGSQEITLETDYNITSQGFPKGIQVNAEEIQYISGGNGWITLSGGSNGDLFREIGIMVESNPGTSPRSAKIYVKAGNMTKVIQVVQDFTFTKSGY